MVAIKELKELQKEIGAKEKQIKWLKRQARVAADFKNIKDLDEEIRLLKLKYDKLKRERKEQIVERAELGYST